ncbi:tetratricopeptide repeat protein [Allokutzneria sp. NRRL B-24872]|uniref:ATP-binding protein n=1 Tax=Allokutzneria sp. NRRL B-24872 TaxID=1137961 RepID=UPI000A374C06|nr:tetratricopeptide repeat protein [Allokutzneria sp. NRRL B-24872]
MSEQLAAAVRRLRKRAGLTQEALAERSGISVSTIRGIETGKRGNPQLASVRMLARALDLTQAEQEELVAAASGTTAAPELPVPRQLPAAPRGFTGRARELARLTAAVGEAPVVVSAFGGTGKTALVLWWGHQHIDLFPDGQLYVNLRGFGPSAEPMPPAEALRAFLTALGVDHASVPAGDGERAALYRSAVAGRKMLVVLDNAADTEQVVPLLPGGTTCSVIITSRRPLTGVVASHGAMPVRLDVLRDGEARALLAHRVGESRVTREPDAVGELVERCAGLPLALVVVAARASVSPDAPLARIAEELRDDAHRLDALDTDAAETSPRAVLSWSYRALSSDAITLAGLLSLAPGNDISAAAVDSLSPVPPRRALAELEAASLLTRSPDDRYRMHDLVRLHAAESAEHTVPAPERAEALRRLVDFYLHTALPGDTALAPHIPPIDLPPPVPGCHPLVLDDALAWFDAEHHCLLEAQRLALSQGWNDLVWQLAWALKTYHYVRYRMDAQRETWQRALTATRALGVPELIARASRILGDACARLRLPEAFEHLQAALALVEQGDDLNEKAHTHRSLTVVSDEFGDHERALHHASEALALYKASGYEAREAEALNAVGYHMARLGRYDEALPICQRALARTRELDNPIAEASTLDDLGLITQSIGALSSALDHYDQAHRTWRRLGYNQFAADSLRHLGKVHLELGDRTSARQAWEEALELLPSGKSAQTVRELIANLGSST